MITVEALKSYGANTEEGLSRCMNNEAFYLRMIGLGLGDANFGKLRDAVASGDAREAFEAAHALKGVMGNLSLTPIYEPLSELTELLRDSDEIGDVTALMGSINDQVDKLRAMNE